MRAAGPLLLLFCLPAAAAPRVTGPAQVPPGGFAELAVDGARPGTVMWLVVTPEPVQQDEINGTLVFTGTPGTTYTAVAVVADFDAKTMTRLRFQVAFLGGPPPQPIPPVPPPAPPAPVDPLAAALKAAAAKDGIGPAGLSSLAAGFQAAADLAKNRATAGDLQGMLAAAIKGKLPAKPAATWAVLAPQLDALEAVAPSGQPDRALSDADKATATALFAKLANSCSEAAK